MRSTHPTLLNPGGIETRSFTITNAGMGTMHGITLVPPTQGVNFALTCWTPSASTAGAVMGYVPSPPLASRT